MASDIPETALCESLQALAFPQPFWLKSIFAWIFGSTCKATVLEKEDSANTNKAFDLLHRPFRLIRFSGWVGGDAPVPQKHCRSFVLYYPQTLPIFHFARLPPKHRLFFVLYNPKTLYFFKILSPPNGRPFLVIYRPKTLPFF